VAQFSPKGGLSEAKDTNFSWSINVYQPILDMNIPKREALASKCCNFMRRIFGIYCGFYFK